MRRALLPVLLLIAATAAATAQPATAAPTTAQRIVALARAELAKNVHEVPDGSNRSPDISRYVASTSPSWLGAPWCAYFVSYIARNAGVPIGAGGKGLGYVPYIQQWARRTGRWRSRPLPGYLVTWPSHVGIVETVTRGGFMTTIEGNAGNAVRRRLRRTTDASGFVALAAGGSVTTTPRRPAVPAPGAPAVRIPLKARITLYPSATVRVGQTLQVSANDSSGPVSKVRWDLNGDGRFTDGKGDSISLRVTKPGRRRIAVRVFGTGAAHADARAWVTVAGDTAPVARLDMPDQVVVGTTVTADASASSDPEGGPLTFEWDLNGDGSFGRDGEQHDFTYRDPGVYRAVVRVTDEDGNTTEASHQITVVPPPPPSVTLTCDAAVVQTGQATTCHADVSVSPVDVSRIEWDTNDDGVFARGDSSRTITVTTPGDHPVHVRVTARDGQQAQADTVIQATNRPPTAVISAPTSIRLGDTLRLDASTSTDPDGYVAAVRWDLNADGSWDATGKRVYTTPTVIGPFRATVEVTDDAGATATATVTVDVRPRY